MLKKDEGTILHLTDQIRIRQVQTPRILKDAVQ
jgi:hypothetical protein